MWRRGCWEQAGGVGGDLSKKTVCEFQKGKMLPLMSKAEEIGRNDSDFLYVKFGFKTKKKNSLLIFREMNLIL